MNKVITRILGGIGNQLFCYAAARRLALVNNSELVIDNVSGFVRDFVYQRHYQLDNFRIPCRKATLTERLEPFPRFRRSGMRFFNNLKPFERRNYIQQEGIDFDPRLLNVSSRGTLYLEGYWQSEGYFKDIESTVRTDLQIIAPTDVLNQQIANKIQNCQAVALHVRWFDMPSSKSEHNASLKYYNRAISIMELRLESPQYFLFSDNIEAASTLLDIPENRLTCVSHNKGDDNAYADLWLMTLCKHFIIANSTFSWWGAWLSESPNKIIISPDMTVNGVAAWGFTGLIPNKWTQVKCI